MVASVQIRADRTGSSAALLRREQFTVLAGRSIPNALCSLASFLTIMAAFWNGGPHALLIGLFCLLFLLHAVAVQRSRAWLSGPRTNLSNGQLILRVVLVALIAMSWSAALLSLMPTADSDHRQVMVYVFAGLTASSLLIASVLPAALAMASINSIAMLAVIPSLHQAVGLQRALLVVMFFFVTVFSIWAQHRDFCRRVEGEATMREQNDTIALLFKEYEESANDWLWSVDAQFRLCGQNDRFLAVTGCPDQVLSNLDMRSFLDRGCAGFADEIDRFLAAVEARVPFRDIRLPFLFEGRGVWLCLSGRPVLQDGAFVGYRGVASNVTEAQRSSDQIAYLARYDSLTGLPNRTLFAESLQSAVDAQAEAQPGRLALLCLDLDGFKPINDTYGHGVGDELLVMVAKRLRGCVREGDLVCRLGGDEFAILSRDADGEVPALLAERLLETIAKPFGIRELRVSISLSIGVVMVRDDVSSEQLMQAGDIALYVSKRRGRGTWSLFEQSMADVAQERHLLQNDLRDAIEGDGLALAFQPIIDVRDRCVICVKVLARWVHPVLGAIPPDRFIPLAEDNGLIVSLGAWVLRRACAEASTWPDDVCVAVNLSPLQLRDPGLLSVIDDALAVSGLSPRRLEIEITESVFLEDAAGTLACLQALHHRGIRISLDDFGTGYSSLSYLRSFPFDKVKIDRSFVRDIGESPQALSIVKAIVGMASSLDMNTTGEGVETTQQADMLETAGCDQFQGFLFGRPCTKDDIVGVIRSQNTQPV